MAFLLGRVVTHVVAHDVLDYAQRQQELEQERRRQARAMPGVTLQIVAEATVRSGPRLTSQIVGELFPGERVTAVAEEREEDGHQRVCIGEGRWISRVTRRGNVLAQQLSQPEEPMSSSMVAHEMAIPPVNAPDVSHAARRAVAGGGAQHTTRAEAGESNARGDDSSFDPSILSDLQGQSGAEVARAVVALVAGFVCVGWTIGQLGWGVDNIVSTWRWAWWLWFLLCWYLASTYM
jgi:hypothetical protein